MFSSTYCPPCNKAKKLLQKYEIAYSDVPMDKIAAVDQRHVSNCLYGRSEQRFVPVIFFNQKKLGGFGELLALEKNGGLVPNKPPPQQQTE